MAGYIDSIVPTSPITSDDPADFPAEMRAFKGYVKDSFTGVSGAVTPTHTELNYVAGATSNIQAQIDAIEVSGGSGGDQTDASGQGDVLDLTSASYIGDMTSGSGLAAVFDDNTSVVGYAEEVTGYAGVDLSAAPKRVYSALFHSGASGFNASGIDTVMIQVSLYGKNSGAPSNGTDGTLLGTTGEFADVDSSTVQIESNDKTTEWDYIWGYVETGVWSSLAEMYITESTLTGAESLPELPSGRTIVAKSVNTLTPYTWASTEIAAFRMRFEITAASIARIDLRIETVHRGDITGYNGAIGIGIRTYYRYAAAEVDLDGASFAITSKNGVGGANIVDRSNDHYALNIVSDVMLLAVGFYEFTVYATAHSTGSGLDGLAGLLVEGDHGLNKYIVDISQSADLLDL